MTGVFIIAAHHLRRVVRNPGLILVLIAIPLTLSTIEYFAFGRTAAAGKLPPIKVLFLDEDQTLASRFVPQFFSGGPAKDMFEVSPVTDRAVARDMFRSNEAAALIVTPKGFGDRLLAGSRAEIELSRNPIQTFSPEAVQSVLEMLTVMGNGLYAQAGEPIRRIKRIVDENRSANADEIAAISVSFYEAGRRFSRFGALNDVKLSVERPGHEATSKVGPSAQDFFGYIFPGLVIFALMFIGQALAIRLLRDKVLGRERRVSIAPISPNAALGGNVVYLVTGLFVVLVVLGLIGSLIFGIHLRAPVALLSLGFGFAVFVTGLHLFVVSNSESDRGAAFISGVIIMVLSLLGGSFVPPQAFPPWLAAMAITLPNGATQQGIVDVLVNNKGFGEVVRAMGTTWAWGAIFLLLALRGQRAVR